jgi:hypothetical protein
MEIATITNAIRTGLSGFGTVNRGPLAGPLSLSVFRQARRGCPKTCSVQSTLVSSSSVSLGKIGDSEPGSTGTALALIPVVRLTTPRDEHTTVAIRGTDAAHAGASVIVPSAGIDLVAVERALIQCAPDSHGGNRTHAARFLGLSCSALLYRMQKHTLIRPQGTAPDPAAQS